QHTHGSTVIYWLLCNQLRIGKDRELMSTFARVSLVPGATDHSGEDHGTCGGQTHGKTCTVDRLLFGVARACVDRLWAGSLAASCAAIPRHHRAYLQGFHP